MRPMAPVAYAIDCSSLAAGIRRTVQQYHRTYARAFLLRSGMDTVCMYQREAPPPLPHPCRSWEDLMLHTLRHSSLRRALVLQDGMALQHETPATATHHQLPSALHATDLPETEPVCACPARRPSNASTLRPGRASTRAAPGMRASALCSPGATAPLAYTRFGPPPSSGIFWATEI